MTSRATSRHRSAQRAATPLSTLTTAVGEHVGTIGRGGVVIAMSSGLVATMGLPAQGATAKATTTPAKAAPTAETLGSLADLDVEPLTASPTAKVNFDRNSGGTFTAKRTPAPVADRTVARASRSGTRSTNSSVSAGSSHSSAVSVASRYLGVEYRSGGSSPSGFDCSGLVQYVYAQLGISLPRTANDQMGATTAISASEAVAGDLVFFVNTSGRAYHVGIYLGDGMMIDAPRSGKVVQKRAVFSNSVSYRRA